MALVLKIIENILYRLSGNKNENSSVDPSTTSNMTDYSKQHYVIVGAGVFGISTAYHITKKFPGAKVTIIDRTPFPCEAGASWDSTKAVRADYAHLFWCKLAWSAVDMWRNDPLFKPHFHEVGMVWLDDTGHAQRVLDTYKELAIPNKAKMVSVKELTGMYPGLFDTTDYTGVSHILVNTMSGCAEAEKAVESVYDYVISQPGVEYKAAVVEKVLFDDYGDTIGVLTTAGEKILGDTTFLCTSSYTSKLLADSAPGRPEMHPGHRLGALGFATGQLVLSERQREEFKKSPVFQQGTGKLQTLSMGLHSNGTLKIGSDLPIYNEVHVKGVDHPIRCPPEETNYDQFHVPPVLVKELDECAVRIFGDKAKELVYDPHSYRICWDIICPDGDFLITQHPHSKNLVVATGGSYHGFKFLPVIGKYILDIATGDIDEEKRTRWAWDRDNGGDADEGLLPARRLSDLFTAKQ
ncbi:hypothetical protein AOL_s00117g57 [Orbilia oligospora ATCC 24927]|uniref:FAD dependent oxidoreductase domain-containing protein n=3 Tax=Orbilia oligospora TaxID=2813651 RepID=G1XM10_ARTOA|nr:hypothetical protein AOL_s00117g57 [Orbilia oligospora ATCC 24927]EGX45852.1 hypothetical protein AOL_s00117g57 [Orbilia oligospora ATCC 24927]KAF3284310.1 hypothetical protein TWF970_011530 [Orbilia oligospora]